MLFFLINQCVNASLHWSHVVQTFEITVTAYGLEHMNQACSIHSMREKPNQNSMICCVCIYISVYQIPYTRV